MHIDDNIKDVVLLFGAGSLGANTAINLGRRFTGEVHIVIVDDDVIEAVNLANQPWFSVNVGQKKATVLAANLYLTSKTTAIPVITRITDAQNFIDTIHSISTKITFCIDCFDNIVSRRLTQKIGNMLTVPVLHAGFSETIFLAAWNRDFPLKSISKNRRPVCDRRELGTIVTLGASMTCHVATLFITKNIMKGSFIELSEFGISA